LRRVEPFAHLLAGSKNRNALGFYLDGTTGSRVAPQARFARFDGEDAKPSQLDTIAIAQRRDDLVEHRVDDALDVAVIEVRVVLSDLLDKLGFNHSPTSPPRLI